LSLIPINGSVRNSVGVAKRETDIPEVGTHVVQQQIGVGGDLLVA